MVVVGTQSGKFRAFLKTHVLHQAAYLVVVGVERQTVVFEIIDGVGVAVAVRHVLAANRTHHANSPRIDAGEGFLLVVVYHSVTLHIHVHILHAAGQLQTARTIPLWVYVPAAAYRKQAGIELGIVGHVPVKARQTGTIGQCQFLAMLTAAQVHSFTLYPPFHTDGFSKFLQTLVTVFACVVYDNVVRTFHRAHLEIGCVVHAVVDILNNKAHVLYRTGGQREHCFIGIVHRLQHQKTLDQALYAVQLHVVFPFHRALLVRKVFLHGPVPLTLKVHIVVHVNAHILVERERKAQHVVALNLLVLRTAVIRLQPRLFVASLAV